MQKLINTSLLLLVLILSSCTNTKNAKHTLEVNGYTKIKMTGFDMFGCGNDDKFADGFTAKSPNGEVVTGTVCSGFFKGSTIRLD
jgi:hypothetical protein